MPQDRPMLSGGFLSADTQPADIVSVQRSGAHLYLSDSRHGKRYRPESKYGYRDNRSALVTYFGIWVQELENLTFVILSTWRNTVLDGSLSGNYSKQLALRDPARLEYHAKTTTMVLATSDRCNKRLFKTCLRLQVAFH